ncbi:MAG: allose kinase [Oscillospiraceae bacterium]
MNPYVVGIDVGGTNIRIGREESGGSLVDFRKVPCKSVFTGVRSAQALAKFVMDYVSENCHGINPLAVAVGFPATLSANRDKVLQAPNVAGINGLEAAAVADILGIPVYFERDVNLLYLSDIAANSLKNQGVGVGIYVGTGIGNAIFINGVPLVGKDGAAGELGHIAIPGNKTPCGCGNVGCSECVASGWHLVELQKQFFPDTPIGELFLRHSADSELQEYTDAVACVIATEINLLNPEVIILGGGVLNMQGFPLEALKERIYAHARKPYPAESLRFYFSKDAVENGVLGGIVYAKSRCASGF